jgi:hypothetical protein
MNKALRLKINYLKLGHKSPVLKSFNFKPGEIN